MALRLAAIERRLREKDDEVEGRHRTILAIVELAATLAVEFQVVPKKWGNPSSVVNRILAHLADHSGTTRSAELLDQKRLRRLC